MTSIMILYENNSSKHIHASCVAKDGNAIMFVGPSGSGKSTHCWKLLQHGYKLIADDVVQITQDYICSAVQENKGLLHLRNTGMQRLPANQITPSAKLKCIIRLNRDQPPSISYQFLNN